MDKLLNFDLVAHLREGEGSDLFIHNTVFKVRHGIMDMYSRPSSLARLDGTKLLKVKDDGMFHVGDRFSINGIAFLVVEINDYGRQQICVPLTWFLSPLAGMLYLRHQYRTQIHYSMMRFAIKHHLMLTSDDRKPQIRDFILLRNGEISRLRAELAKTQKTLDKVALERDKQQLRAMGAEQREEKLRSAMAVMRDVAREHI